MNATTFHALFEQIEDGRAYCDCCTEEIRGNVRREGPMFCSDRCARQSKILGVLNKVAGPALWTTHALLAAKAAFGEAEGPTVKIKQQDTMFTAYIKGRVAGRLIVDQYAKPLEVFKVAVNEPYRRQGVATAMYRAAEAAFGPLVPARTHSDDAFGFWSKYRPEALDPHSFRWPHNKERLMGQTIVDPSYGPGVITSVSDKGVIATKPDGRTYFSRDVQHLLDGV